MAIEIEIGSSSIVELRQQLVALRGQIAKTTNPDVIKQFEAEITKVNEAIVQQASNYDAAGKSVSTLRQEFKVLQDFASEATDTGSEGFQALARASGQARDGIIAVNEQINQFAAGTVFEQAQLQLSGIRDGLLGLDFDKVAESAANLSNTIKSAGSLKEVFGDIGGAVKNLGNVFLQLGKQLLMNPLFLLATVVGVLVVALVAFMDKIGVLKKVMQAVAAPFNAFMKVLTDITDALGISAVAQKELADATIAAGERIRADIERRKNAELGFAKLGQDLTEETKKRLQQQFGIAIDFTKDELKIRQEANQSQIDSYRKTFRDLYETRQKEGKLNEEQQKKYEEADTKLKELETEKQLLIAESAARIDATNRNLEDQLEKYRAENVEGEVNKNKKLLDLEKQRVLDQIASQEKLTGNTEVAAKLRAEVELLYANKIREIDKKLSEERSQSAKQRVENGLQQLREEQELLILQTEEGSLRRFEAEKNAVDKILQYQIDNAKRLGLNETQINILKEKALDEREKLDKDYADKQRAVNNKLLDLQNEITLLSIKNARERADKELEIQKQKAIDEIKLSTATEEQKAKLIAEINKKYDLITDKNKEDRAKEDRQKAADDLASKESTEASAAAFALEMFKGGLQGKLDALGEFQTQEQERLDAQREADLLAAGEDEMAKAAIEEQYRQDSIRLNQQTIDLEREARFAFYDEIANKASEGLNAIASLSNFLLDLESENLKEGTKEAEAAARKKFEINKAFQLGAAIIDGFKAVTSSLAQSPIAIGPIPNPAGIASLAFAITTSAANVIKIAAQQYKSKSSGSGAKPTVAGSPIPNNGGSIPSLGLFPGQNLANPLTTGPTGPPPPPTEITVKALVVESEITETQSNIKKIQSASELGG